MVMMIMTVSASLAGVTCECIACRSDKRTKKEATYVHALYNAHLHTIVMIMMITERKYERSICLLNYKHAREREGERSRTHTHCCTEYMYVCTDVPSCIRVHSIERNISINRLATLYESNDDKHLGNSQFVTFCYPHTLTQ